MLPNVLVLMLSTVGLLAVLHNRLDSFLINWLLLDVVSRYALSEIGDLMGAAGWSLVLLCLSPLQNGVLLSMYVGTSTTFLF